MKKKILYIGLLIIVIIGIVLLFIFLGNVNKDSNNNTNTLSQIVGMRNSSENITENENTVNEVSNTTTGKDGKTKITKLNDGVLYSLEDKQEEAEVVIGDNYFDTQINDIMLNYGEYEGKTVEIEGMYIDVYKPYTIIGRYSTSNLCAYCPVGYSAFEYIWNGEKIKLENEKSWLKIKGTFTVGNDYTSNFKDYYYIDATSIEVMNEEGLKTVSN